MVPDNPAQPLWRFIGPHVAALSEWDGHLYEDMIRDLMPFVPRRMEFLLMSFLLGLYARPDAVRFGTPEIKLDWEDRYGFTQILRMVRSLFLQDQGMIRQFKLEGLRALAVLDDRNNRLWIDLTDAFLRLPGPPYRDDVLHG